MSISLYKPYELASSQKVGQAIVILEQLQRAKDTIDDAYYGRLCIAIAVHASSLELVRRFLRLMPRFNADRDDDYCWEIQRSFFWHLIFCNNCNLEKEAVLALFFEMPQMTIHSLHEVCIGPTRDDEAIESARYKLRRILAILPDTCEWRYVLLERGLMSAENSPLLGSFLGLRVPLPDLIKRLMLTFPISTHMALKAALCDISANQQRIEEISAVVNPLVLVEMAKEANSTAEQGKKDFVVALHFAADMLPPSSQKHVIAKLWRYVESINGASNDLAVSCAYSVFHYLKRCSLVARSNVLTAMQAIVDSDAHVQLRAEALKHIRDTFPDLKLGDRYVAGSHRILVNCQKAAVFFAEVAAHDTLLARSLFQDLLKGTPAMKLRMLRHLVVLASPYSVAAGDALCDLYGQMTDVERRKIVRLMNRVFFSCNFRGPMQLLGHLLIQHPDAMRYLYK